MAAGADKALPVAIEHRRWRIDSGIACPSILLSPAKTFSTFYAVNREMG